MYPHSFSDLIALLGVIIPFFVASGAGLTAAVARSREVRLARWRRVQELARILYYKERADGQWAQTAAAMELSEAVGVHRRAAKQILLDAHEFWIVQHSSLASVMQREAERMN